MEPNVKLAEVIKPDEGLSPGTKLGLLLFGAAIVGIAIALGVPRRVVAEDGTPPPKPADVPPPDDHNGGHHEITAEMIEAAEREKAAAKGAAAPEVKP